MLPDPQPAAPRGQILPLGQEALLIRFGDGQSAHPQAALGFAGVVEAAALAGVVEIAPSLTSVQVRFDPARVTRAQLTAQIGALLAAPRPPVRPLRRLWTIPASFGGEGGPQWEEACALAGLRSAAALAQIAAQELSVLAIGFAPGQPYLGTLPEAWSMPRQSGLTPQVPAGAIVTALRQLVLFANPSPTGWRWIGSCAFLPFVADRAEPFALRPDDRIRFLPTDPQTVEALRAQSADGMGGARCEAVL